MFVRKITLCNFQWKIYNEALIPAKLPELQIILFPQSRT